MGAVSTQARKVGEPAWEIAHLFPLQGSWSEEEYLRLDTNRLVEYSDGFIEVLPMPTEAHQVMVAFLFAQMLAFVEPQKLGKVLFAPLKVRTRAGEYREPDIVFMLAKHAHRRSQDYWKGADLVMEVVSPGKENRERDLKEKRRDYAKGGIQEYWIIDPKEENILVLKLGKRGYVVHGEFGRGEQATSVLLDGFEIDVSAVLDAE